MKPILRFFLPLALASLSLAPHRATAQPATVMADPTTGALFRPAASTFISGNSLLTTTGAAAAYQPLDSDLTAIAALTTTANGRSLLTSTTLTLAGLGITNGTTLDTIGAKTQNGTGNLVLATSPTLTTPNIGAATATSITGPTATNLTLTGGSSGASLVLESGVNGSVNVNPKGTGSFVVGSVGLSNTFTTSIYGASALNLVAIGANTTVGLIEAYSAAYAPLSLAMQTAGGNLLIGTTTDMTGSGGAHVAGVSTARDTTSGAFRVGSNIGLSGNAGGASYFGGPVSFSGNTPSPTEDGQGFAGTTSTQGFILQGRGSTNDFNFYNKSGASVLSVATGTQNINITGTSPSTSSTTGALTIGNGTAATNVAIGGGNVNAGGTLTAGDTITMRKDGGAAAFVNGVILNNQTTTGAVTQYFTDDNASASYTRFVRYGSAHATKAGAFEIGHAGTGYVSLTSTEASTGSTSGALRVTGGIYAGAASVFGSTATFAGAVTTSSATLSGAGAIPITTSLVKFTSTGAAQALTLANGTDGKRLTIVHDVDGGSGVLTPTTKTGFSTVTFTNAGDTVSLVYVTTRGWMVTGSYGVTIAP